MLVLAGNLIGEVLDGLMRMERTIEHIEFFLENSKVPSIRTILNVEDRVLMMLDLLHHARVFNIEDTKHS
jgi:hypothetical protein